jgi:hypothetical protein
MIGVAWKVLSIEIDLNLSDEQIANATPSQSTLANWEFRLGAECYLKVADEVTKKPYSLSQDGAHKLGTDHLIKTISYEHNGAIKNVCLDADGSGKSTEAIVEAIAKSLKKLLKYAPNSKCISLITCDSGSAGACWMIFKLLILMFPDLARFIHCILHAYNKGVERAVVASMGPQGHGMNTCIQLLYTSMKMCIELIKNAGGKHTLFDEFYHAAVRKLWEDPEWQSEAENSLKQSFDEWWKIMNDDETSELMEELLNAPRNLQLPLFQSLKKDKPAFKAGFYFDHAGRSLSRLVFSKFGIWNFCLVLSFQKSEITCLVLSCLFKKVKSLVLSCLIFFVRKISRSRGKLLLYNIQCLV